MPPGMSKIMGNGIELIEVTFAYSKKKPVLKNINLRISSGSFTGITGVNGSGKTSLIYLFNGIIPRMYNGIFRGDVIIDGKNTRDTDGALISKKVGLVFQNPELSLFNLTVEEEIRFGLINLKMKNVETRIDRALKSVGLTGFNKRDPQTLSLGEKQKVSLAGVLSMETAYIVLDEPTAMLDYKSSVELYNLLSGLNRRGITVITVEHNTEFLLKHADNVLVMNRGEIIMEGKTGSIFRKKNELKKLGIKIPGQI